MSQVQQSGWCPVCGRQSMFVKQRLNHVLHLILSIVTFGLWLFIWAILGIVNSSRLPRCATCGTRAGDTPTATVPGHWNPQDRP